MVQFDWHTRFAVGLVVGVTLLGVTVGETSDTPGTRQLLWQLAAEALHVIMQLVMADVTVDEDGADVDGTVGATVCANALVDAAAVIAAAITAITMTTPRITVSIA